MNDSEKLSDWLKWYKASPAGYQMNALLAILENDGEVMLGRALKELGLESSLDLVKDAKKRGS